MAKWSSPLAALARNAAATAAGAVSRAANVTGHAAPALAASVCSAAQPSCLLQRVATCDSAHCHEWITALVFPFLALSLGCLLQPTARIVRMPYSLLLLATGIVLGLLGCAVNMGYLTRSLQQWVHLSPPGLFFYVFLAPLIFEAAFNTQWHIFRRLLIPILTAAFAIVLAQTGLIAAFTRAVVDTSGVWASWWPALMFGAMLSATDPISVTATLKALGASENLGTLIEGESLVNDGSAFVIWEAFFHNAEHLKDPDKQFSPAGILAMVLKSSIGGALLGILFALVVLAILTLIYDEFEVETSLTVVVAFLGFWTAQSPARLSGVIANVASGLTLSAYGRPLISNSVRHPLSEFWELLAWIANTIVFIHAGVLGVAFVWPCSTHLTTARDYLLIFAFFLFLQVIRVGLFAITYPILSWRNPWFTWKEDLVVGMSGLRGSVSLVLALNVAGASDINEIVRSRIVLWTTGIVLLSLVVNGLMIPWLLHILKLDTPNKTRENFFRRARATTVQATLATLDKLCVDFGFRAARWSYVVENVLPKEWLEDSADGQDFADAAEDIITSSRAHRASLDFLHDEHNRVAALAARQSNDMHGELEPMLEHEPRRLSLVHGLDPWNNIALNSMRTTPAPGVSARTLPQSGTRESMRRDSVASRTSITFTPLPPALRPRPLSPGLSSAAFSQASLGSAKRSVEIHMRRSIDIDAQRYASLANGQGLAALEELPPFGDGDDELLEGELSPRDLEVRRRVLTGMLSHIRALSNSTLIEYSAIVRLEDDLQSALDANDEGRDYDLFSEIHRKSLLERALSCVVDPRKFSGEHIVAASVMVAVLTEILKQDVLNQSLRVRRETEELYRAALKWLHELERINPKGLRWVHSQFAIHVTETKQNAALNDMRHSGVIDAFEYKVLREELTKVRRRHAVHARRLWRKQNLPARKLLAFHPMFADWFKQGSEVLTRPTLTLEPGHVLPLENSALVVVLGGAVRPIEEGIQHAAAVNALTDFPKPERMSLSLKDRKGPASRAEVQNESTLTASTFKPNPHHWCFSAPTAFCAPSLTCAINNPREGNSCDHAQNRLIENVHMCCNISSTATVFTMSETEVRQKAKLSKAFRNEVTRSLARELVLQSVADQKTYHLRMLNEALGNKLDEHTEIGRAFRILERLPYMTVIRLHAGTRDRGMTDLPRHRELHGPGVLVNGTVRVSIVDTSGLVGAVNLLHERLQGPALLPAGGLIIEEVLDEAAEKANLEQFMDGAQEEVGVNGEVDIEKVRKQHEIGPVIAHVLVDDQSGFVSSAKERLERWTGYPNTVDMNGRFCMFRHVTHGGVTKEQAKQKRSGESSSSSSASESAKADEKV